MLISFSLFFFFLLGIGVVFISGVISLRSVFYVSADCFVFVLEAVVKTSMPYASAYLTLLT